MGEKTADNVLPGTHLHIRLHWCAVDPLTSDL